MKPPYKSETNQWYTLALFWDKVIDTPIERRTIKPIFTLHDDKEGYICARKTFVELGDPSGYKWAIKYLGDYQHWKALEKCKWFQAALAEWRHELMIKEQSEALDTIREISKRDGDKQQLPAARYLAEFGRDKSGRGRPSKAEITGELKRSVELLSVEDEDLKRIGLVK